jgi:hypothetical protein
MNRLKFLVFALVSLGLWGYHLLKVSPALGAPGEPAARSAVAGAPPAVALALESRRSELQAAVMKLAASPAVLNVGPKPGAKVEPPGVDRFAAVRPVVTDALKAESQAQVVIGLVNEAGGLWGQGAAEPGPAPEGFDPAPLVAAGAAGSLAVYGTAPTLFYATPLLISDKNEVRAAGTALVGLPLLPDVKALEAILKAGGLSALALASDGKVLVSAGDKGVDEVFKQVKAGSIGVLSSGPVRTLGPLELPLLVGALPHAVALRQAIAGTPFEVVAVASSVGSVQALAGYQVFAVGGLAGLLLLTIVFTLLIGSGSEDEGARMVVPPPMPIPPVAVKREEAPGPAPLPVPDHAPAPEASPDDFDFPASGSSATVTGQAPAHQPPPPEPQPEPPPEPEADPFASLAPPPPVPSYPPTRSPSQPPAPPAPPAPPPARQPPPPPAASKPPPPVSPFQDEDEGARTVAYPAFKPPTAGAPPSPTSDPFAMAASQFADDGANYEDNAESTRVAAVPQELIKQARSGAAGTTGERPSLRPPTTSLPRVQSVAPVGGASEEDRHFQDVFRDFVATREKCGEPADGLTFDKFKAKLLKNKEQLVAKYQCRTVRFQVYVKEGKAALKATPVKD